MCGDYCYCTCFYTSKSGVMASACCTTIAPLTRRSLDAVTLSPARRSGYIACQRLCLKWYLSNESIPPSAGRSVSMIYASTYLHRIRDADAYASHIPHLPAFPVPG